MPREAPVTNATLELAVIAVSNRLARPLKELSVKTKRPRDSWRSKARQVAAWVERLAAMWWK